MFSRSLAASGCLIAAFGVAACGGDDDDGDPAATETAAKSVTIYSSYPLQGAGRAQSIAAVNGAKLALEQAGGKAGDITVTYTPLDDSTAQAANWTPEQTSANARKAAQDESTALYLGEFNSGATAVSLPILNEAGVAQISPSNTAVGLTSDEPGATPGEPDKYYPTGQRTFARIVPKDTIQGAALATLMKEDGCTKVQLLNDKEVYGAGLARNIESSAKAQGLTIISNESTDKNAANYRSLAARRPRYRRTRTAWSSPASRPTTPCRCSRTSPPRCPTPSSTGLTVSPIPASPARRRASRPTSPSARR